MKILFLGLLFLCNSNLYANVQWTNYTPSFIFTEIPVLSIIRNRIIIRTKGSRNSCSRFFERVKYRTEVISCENKTLKLSIEIYNPSECQQSLAVSQSFSVNVSDQCLMDISAGISFPGDGTRIIINNREFDTH